MLKRHYTTHNNVIVLIMDDKNNTFDTCSIRQISRYEFGNNVFHLRSHLMCLLTRLSDHPRKNKRSGVKSWCQQCNFNHFIFNKVVFPTCNYRKGTVKILCVEVIVHMYLYNGNCERYVLNQALLITSHLKVVRLWSVDWHMHLQTGFC